MQQRPRRVVVAGMIAADPHQGGATWAVMQYVLALRQLGHDVVVVDPMKAGPVPAVVSAYFDAVCASFNLSGHAVLVPSGGDPVGMDADALQTVLSRADVLFNVSGRWRDHDAVRHVPVRVYIDVDPGFTQIWHAQGADIGIEGHTHHVTVGAGIADGSAIVPTDGFEWRAILPPVLFDQWPAQPPPRQRRLTTVANWRSYGRVEHDGVHYGQKAHAIRALARLPEASPVPLAIALSIDDGDGNDRQAILDAGWQLLDPTDATGTPDRYRAFVQASWGEIGIAKTGYVVGRTGWFSDRSACYLASGRPVVAQDTGLSSVLPVGAGLLTFDDADGAAEAIARLEREYPRHHTGAREIAEEHLDARRIVGGLMREVTA